MYSPDVEALFELIAQKIDDNTTGAITPARAREVLAGLLTHTANLSTNDIKGSLFRVPFVVYESNGQPTVPTALIPARMRIQGMDVRAISGTDAATALAGVKAPPIDFKLVANSAGTVDALVDELSTTTATVKASWVRTSGTDAEKILTYPELILEDHDYAAGEAFRYTFADLVPPVTRLLFWRAASTTFQHPLPTGRDDDPIYGLLAPLVGSTAYDDSDLQDRVHTLEGDLVDLENQVGAVETLAESTYEQVNDLEILKAAGWVRRTSTGSVGAFVDAVTALNGTLAGMATVQRQEWYLGNQPATLAGAFNLGGNIYQNGATLTMQPGSRLTNGIYFQNGGNGLIQTSATGGGSGHSFGEILIQGVRVGVNLAVAAGSKLVLDGVTIIGTRSITYSGTLVIHAGCDLNGNKPVAVPVAGQPIPVLIDNRAAAGSRNGIYTLADPQWEAPLNGVDDDGPALRAIIAAMRGQAGVIDLGVGRIYLKSGVVLPEGVAVLGRGANRLYGHSDGTLDYPNRNAPTRIFYDDPSITPFSFTSFNVTLRGFSIEYTGPASSLPNVAIVPDCVPALPPKYPQESLQIAGMFLINDITMRGMNTGIHVQGGWQWSITGCTFNTAKDSLIIENRAQYDAGDMNVSDNWFLADANGYAAVRYLSGGGLRFTNNKINIGWLGTSSGFCYAYGLWGTVINTVDLLVSGNSFENYTAGAIRLDNSAGAPGADVGYQGFSQVVINGNQFAAYRPTSAPEVFADNVRGIVVGTNVFSLNGGNSQPAVELHNCTYAAGALSTNSYNYYPLGQRVTLVGGTDNSQYTASTTPTPPPAGPAADPNTAAGRREMTTTMAGMALTGDWTMLANNIDSAGDGLVMLVTAQAAGSFTYTFTLAAGQTSFTVYGTRFDKAAAYTANVDGANVRNEVKQVGGSDAANVVLYQATGLSAGVHSFTITKQGDPDSYLTVDYAVVA